jgi:hypothetical protein
MLCIVSLGIAAHPGSSMSNLRKAMKHTTELLRAQVDAVQIVGGNDLPAAPIRRKLETLLCYEIDDGKLRTELLERLVSLLQGGDGPRPGEIARAHLPRVRNTRRGR